MCEPSPGFADVGIDVDLNVNVNVNVKCVFVYKSTESGVTADASRRVRRYNCRAKKNVAGGANGVAAGDERRKLHIANHCQLIDRIAAQHKLCTAINTRQNNARRLPAIIAWPRKCMHRDTVHSAVWL